MEGVIKISIVEDQPVYRDGLKWLISEFPEIRVISEANNGREFISTLSSHTPDIVLMDLDMPEMDGQATTRYLKEHFPAVKVLMLTVYNEAELVCQMMKDGVRGFLVKDSRIEDITEAIRSISERGYYFNDYITRQMIDKLVKGEFIMPEFKIVSLSEREEQVICLLCHEYLSKEIADELGISKRTVDYYKESAMEKIGVATSMGLIVYGVKNGLDTKFKPNKRRPPGS